MRGRSQATRFTMLLTGAMILAGLTACDSGGGDLVRPPAAQALHVNETVLQEAGLQYYWHAGQQVALAPGESVDRIVLLDENIYVITNTANIIAVDAAIGRQRWRETISLEGREVYTPTHVNDMHLRPERWSDTVTEPPDPMQFPARNVVVVNDLAHVLIIDRTDGTVYRDIKLNLATATGAGVCDDRYFYYPGLPDTLYCVDLMLGQSIWWLTYDGIANVPVRHHDGRVYVGTTEGQMKCFDAGKVGSRKWRVDFDGPILAPFHVDATGLFFGPGRQIYGLHPISGMRLWQPVQVNGQIEEAMQVSDSTLYQYVASNGLYAINIASGEVRWMQPNGRSILAVMDGQAYVLDDEQNLNVVNEITGNVEATISMAGFDFFAPNTQAPAIYAATSRGGIYCIRKTGAGRLTAEMLQQK